MTANQDPPPTDPVGPIAAAPTEVLDLVGRFEAQQDAYRSAGYNEAQVRREFIDPLFSALGWDVANEAGRPESYKDVVLEEALRTEDARRAPDYSFRIGNKRKFFLEAKKPAVDIGGGIAPAYQLRRYGWTAGLLFSVLTDFEELAIYDCRVEPAPGDDASIGRVLLVSYHEFAGRWGEIAEKLSRDAVASGALERLAKERRVRGTQPVDTAFLTDIERWRADLAAVIARDNRELSVRDLNYAVQQTIDRIVFLRMCEERDIEEYGQLQTLATTDGVYARLVGLFHAADAKYNSGLFHFAVEPGRAERPDQVTESLTVEDGALRRIIRRLYYPASPYEFSVLPPEILGQVYERFLGKVIRLTDAHEAVVEEKPEVRKAGGVYYTPAAIVDYIVAATLGPLIAGKKPEGKNGVGQLRVIDPACGSGSFLLGAYQFLLDWHLDWYLTNGGTRYANRIYEAAEGTWRLSIAERKRILLNNIFGVDIDAQAVETTKLALCLKVLEHESAESVGQNLRLFHERALPDLASNIKSGNSLVGSEFYGQTDIEFFEDDLYRINAFDWSSAFSEVFSRPRPGFDVVLGNPPYVFGEYLDGATIAYLQGRYRLAVGQIDTYALFIERSSGLARSGGRVSMIVPDALLARDSASATRKLLLDDGLSAIYHCGQVFDAGVSATVFVGQKGSSPKQVSSEIRRGTSPVVEHVCSRSRFEADPEYRLLVHATDEQAEILARLLAESVTLGSLVRVSRGEELGRRQLEAGGDVPILLGEDVSRYSVRPPTRRVASLTKNREFYRSPKIVVVKTGRECIAAIEFAGVATLQSLYNLHLLSPTLAPEAVVACLNSRAVSFWIRKTFTEYKLLFPQLNQSTLEGVPIPRDLANRQSPLVAAVRRLMDFKERASAATRPAEMDLMQRQINGVDVQIEGLVRGLYGIGPQESANIDAALAG
jgi:hypothetical protein